jgi:hypothetical protein
MTMQALAFPTIIPGWRRIACARCIIANPRTEAYPAVPGADGLMFRIEPSYQRKDDAEIALSNAPFAYSADGERWAKWPADYNNVT